MKQIEQIESDDPILNIIAKFRYHLSILKIKENVSNDISFSFQPVDFNTVMNEISTLSVSKSVPVESIPTKLIKENSDIFGQKILMDFNSSLKTGVFPLNQKIADVYPIFTNTSKHHKENYRPVSILPALSKIFERLMFYQINNYMQGKLSKYIFGF